MNKEKSFLEKAKQQGFTPTLQGNWVVWKPTLPTDLMLGAMKLNQDKVAEIIKDTTK